MTIQSAHNHRQRHIALLLAQPPDPIPRVEAQVVGAGRFSVEAPVLPPFPAWQTRDLDIWRYFPPWIGPDEQRRGPLSTGEADQQESIAIGMIEKFIERLGQNLDVYSPR